MKICVLGLGYIGLPAAVLLTHAGHDVLGVDIKREVIEDIKNGVCSLGEPGLQVKFDEALDRGRLSAGMEPALADVFLLAVPTPIDSEKRADLSSVIAAAKSISPYLRSGNLIIVESTIPPGCTKDELIPIFESGGLRVGEDLSLAYCPERVIPGKTLEEMVENARVVGGYDESSTQRAAALYRSFVNGPIHHTNLEEAVLVKLAENAYRDVNIAFANTLANICDRSGLDVRRLTRLANQHPRVNILDSGPGVGGHCIPIDPWFLVQAFPQDSNLLKVARDVNDGRVEAVVARVQEQFAEFDSQEVQLAILGLSYKANVADLRQSPSLEIARRLKSLGYQLRCSDPVVEEHESFTLESPLKVAKGANGLLCLVKHKAFQAFPLSRLKPMLADSAKILDICGYWP